MKYTITMLAVMLAATLNAQLLRVDKVDEFTGSVTKITKPYTIATGASTLRATWGRVGSTTFVGVTSSVDIGCAGALGNYLIFLFDDGTTLRLEDMADIDCGDAASGLFVFDAQQLEGKTIQKVRLKHSELYVDCVWKSKYTLGEYLQVVQ